jgi:hypothetical protein
MDRQAAKQNWLAESIPWSLKIRAQLCFSTEKLHF